MTKMKRITAAILCALFSIISLSAALIFADTDPLSKLSDKLKEAYASGAETVGVYIYYIDTVDYEKIEEEAAAYAESKVEEFKTEGNYTEEEIQAKYETSYSYKYERLVGDAYQDLGIEVKNSLGLEDSAYAARTGAYIIGTYTYEQALVIAESDLVLSLTRDPAIEDERIESEEVTENAYDDDTESGDITEDVGTEDWDDGTVPDETDPEPTTDSTEPTDPTEPPTDAPDLLVGDVDEDGLITATDASNILILAAEMGLGYEPTFEELYAADYNADGNADATDASLILIYAAEEGVK